MKINVLNKYHSITIFFLSSVLWITNLNLSYNFTSLICFFLIATIGVSHGALDNLKGAKLLKKLSIKKNSLFYVAYIILALFVVLLWSILPMITLLIFLLVASFHFGKEDNVFAKRKVKHRSRRFADRRRFQWITYA